MSDHEGPSLTLAPPFRWFAWRPVYTQDRGWQWLRVAHRRRWFMDVPGFSVATGFDHSVGKWER